MKRKPRTARTFAKRPIFHCGSCTSVIKPYREFVMRHNVNTDQIYCPSGLVINIIRRNK